MSRQPFQMVPLPVERTVEKPRRTGLTMMMDWGLPLEQQRNWLELQAPYVDLAKFVVGTARLYDEDYLKAKLSLYAEHDVQGFIGGQFLEYVVATQGFTAVAAFCAEAVRLGFGAVEVSDNVVSMTNDERSQCIRIAIDAGLHVHGEVGSKSEESGAEVLIEQANACFEAGADVVLVEGAELLRDGAPQASLIQALRRDLPRDQVIYELIGPWIANTHHCDVYDLKKFLINTFGPDVNLANVMPEHVWETEALRCGLSVAGPPGK
jgi:phosphosulfolactate synthase